MKWQLQNPWRRALETLTVLVAYYAAGRAGLAVPFTNGNVSPIWPATGIALGAILVFGRHVIPGIAAGAFLVNLFSPLPPAPAIAIAVGSVLGPALAAAMLQKKGVTRIRRLNDVGYLVVYAALGLLTTAVIGPTALYLSGIRGWSGLPSASLVWWVGGCMGVLLITPLVINFAEFRTMKPRLAELALLLLWLVMSTAVLLRQRIITEEGYVFALLPFIIWAAVRFSVAGAALANCLVAAVSVWEAAQGAGPFVAYGAPLYNAGLLQMFIVMLALSGLGLAAAVAERTSVEQALAQEKKLRLAQEQYRTIIETTNDGVWIIDSEYRTTFVNRRLAEMLGYRAEEILNHTPFDFVFPEDVEQKKADLERRRRSSGREVLYNRFRRKDGSEMWATLSTAPVFSESGERSGAFAMLSDVTLLRKTEEALRRHEKLITAGRLAATISHEVNNPLEAVVNILYLLKHEPLNQQGRKYLALAEKQMQRVCAITRRTLGFFRDSSAWVELSVAELLDETLSFYEHTVAARSIRVVKEFSDCGTLSASRGELQQVFANLIANALDAMNGSGVLTLRVSAAGELNPGVQIAVEDNGAGIAAENLDHIFEPFFTTKRNTGTGLGLWVAKEIIHKHGGAISVTTKAGSDEERGTTFSIFLPRAATRSAAA
jgi:PAS domain S-box-containing protein